MAAERFAKEKPPPTPQFPGRVRTVALCTQLADVSLRFCICRPYHFPEASHFHDGLRTSFLLILLKTCFLRSYQGRPYQTRPCQAGKHEPAPAFHHSTITARELTWKPGEDAVNFVLLGILAFVSNACHSGQGSWHLQHRGPKLWRSEAAKER